MATLTGNLFYGVGTSDHELEVVEGRWPTDAAGYVFVVGPDKRRPSGHWFAEHGLLTRIRMSPTATGRVEVAMRSVDNPIAKLRERLPFLFGKVLVLEVSPFGVSNLANTNVQAFEGRLFLGYDVGRPCEVDPETMRWKTAIGRTDDWAAVLPGLVDPFVQVAAHPAPSLDERALYFVNYVQIPMPGATRGTYLARFGADGSFRRFRLAGLPRFDSIHDLKASRRHVVISDLPFVIEPGAFRGEPRTKKAQDFTQLFIVRKDALREGVEEVTALAVKLPIGSGHLFVDEDDDGDRLTVTLQHIPAADLMITCRPTDRTHGSGALIPPDYEGLPFLGLQPTLVGRYVIDTRTGEIIERRLAFDESFYGGVLHTQNVGFGPSRERSRNWFLGATGWDPELVPQHAWDLYSDFAHAVVPMDELPAEPLPGGLGRFDLDAMRLADVYRYPLGRFPHPPTFVPRRSATHDLDGYIVTISHQDGDKELHVFDAANLAQGPIARATAPGFLPPLQLHSCHLDPADARPSKAYRVTAREDALGLLRGFGSERYRALARFTASMLRRSKRA